MLLDAAYQKSLHTPPPLPEGRKPQPAGDAADARGGETRGGEEGGGSGRRRRRRR
jgi:hypothetical protein